MYRDNVNDSIHFCIWPDTDHLAEALCTRALVWAKKQQIFDNTAAKDPESVYVADRLITVQGLWIQGVSSVRVQSLSRPDMRLLAIKKIQ